jgi:hypothetical protein
VSVAQNTQHLRGRQSENDKLSRMGRNRLRTNLGHCDWTEGNHVKPQSYYSVSSQRLKSDISKIYYLSLESVGYVLLNIQSSQYTSNKRKQMEIKLQFVHDKIYNLDLVEYFGRSEWSMKQEE